MTFIEEFRENHEVSLQGARNHVRLVIKNYKQLDKLVFHRQMDVTLKGLIVAGLSEQEAYELIYMELVEGGFRIVEWLNGRTATEVISNS